MSRRTPLKNPGRNGWLMLSLVVVFLTVGVPHWLAGDVAPVDSHADANISKLCRDHGGTPATTVQRLCTVRYGGRVYRMDAITTAGFDADTAHYQRRGCEEANRERRALTGRRRAFIYHPTTGVCERRF
jgi:hypothetical protein